MHSACFGDTLGPGNGAPSVQAYSPDPRRSFGWQLPGPFILCAGVGSHLTRLSDPRLRLTTPVRSLYFSYAVAKRLIPRSPKVKSRCPSVSEFGSLEFPRPRLLHRPGEFTSNRLDSWSSHRPRDMVAISKVWLHLTRHYVPQSSLRRHYVLFLGPPYVLCEPGLVEENGVRDVGRRGRQLVPDFIVGRVIHERQRFYVGGPVGNVLR